MQRGCHVTTAESFAKSKKLKRIQERFHRAETYESSTRKLERDDMLFANADPDHPEWQWPGDVYRNRNAMGEPPRPCIVVNKVRQHNLQVINDGRENKPSVNVHATGFGASSEAAQVFRGADPPYRVSVGCRQPSTWAASRAARSRSALATGGSSPSILTMTPSIRKSTSAVSRTRTASISIPTLRRWTSPTLGGA